jgi:hypothetical protein
MVKPTPSSDAILSSNRFEILGSANFNSQNPPTLADVPDSAATGTGSNNNKGAISKNSGIVTVKTSNKVINRWIVSTLVETIKVSKNKAVIGAIQ